MKHVGNPATAIWAWNSATNEVRTQTAPNIDEPHLERNGRYVAINAENFSLYVWDLQTNTMEIPNTTGISHEASLLGFWMSANTQNAAPWFEVRNDPTTNPPTYYQINTAAAGGEFHLSGQWIQESSTLPGNDPLKQWYVVSTWSTWPPPRVDLGYPWLYIYAVGYQRADGSDRRFLCHTYGSAYQAGDYATLPFATQSPDGKLVMFNSDMGVRPGRVDVFLVEVPQR